MIDLNTPGQTIYLVGIKGQAMTALALLLQARGHRVRGSDSTDVFSTDAVLHHHGIAVERMEAPLPSSLSAVVYSTAYRPDEHVQLQEAQRRGMPVASYPEVLGGFLARMEGIAIAGSHGKTTTTAMVGAMLTAAGRDPTVIVGSPVPAFGGNARIGSSSLLVVEADEYQDKFRSYQPKHLVMTTIDYDHPDFFPSVEAYEEAFRAFAARIPKDGVLVVRSDDPGCQHVLRALGRPVRTFGKGSADVAYVSDAWTDRGLVVQYTEDGAAYACSLQLPGTHNAMNALAAIALCGRLGINRSVMHGALANFTGVARRFQVLGLYHGCPLIDDFAHHPTEVSAAIAAARQRYPGKRLVVVFQPHTYSRTQKLFNGFVASLSADEVIVMEITGSAREMTKTISSSDLVRALPKAVHPQFLPAVADVVAYLKDRLTDHTVVLLLGAGEQWKVASMLQQ